MKTHLKNIVVLLLASCPPLLGAAGPVNLDDCTRAALSRSETLATEQELVSQAEATYDRAWGAILPSVNAYYTYVRRDGSTYHGSGNTSSSPAQQTLRVSGDQPLFRGFRDTAALHAARAFITSEKQSGAWAGLQVYRDVVQGYYARLAAEKDLALLDKELEQYRKRIDLIEERINIGRSRVSEALTLKAARAILKAQRDQVVGQVDVAKEVLSFLTGLDSNIPLDDSEAEPAVMGPLQDYQSKVDSRPDVEAAKANVDAFKFKTSIAKGERLPSADVIANLYAQRPDRHDNGVWDAELAVALPIFTGGIISSDVKIAQSQERVAEDRLTLAQRLALEEIRSLYHNLTADLAQTTSLREAFDASEKNYKAVVKDYDLGLVTNLDVLQALTAYQDTERSLEKVRYLAKIDRRRLEASVAKAMP